MEVIWDIFAWIGIGWLVLQAYSLTAAWLRSRRKRPGPRPQQEAMFTMTYVHPCPHCHRSIAVSGSSFEDIEIGMAPHFGRIDS